MEVGKLSFEPKTLAALQNPVLSAKRKKALRLQALQEWINAHDYGTPLSGAEFKRVGNFSNGMAAQAWLKRYADSGKIVRHEITPFSYFYEIPGKVTTRKLHPTPPEVNKAVEEALDKLPQDTQQPVRTYTFAELEHQAILHSFYVPGYSASSFLAWLKVQG